MDLNNLIQSIDIVEYISQYTELNEKNGEFWGLSPLKAENTPSFSVRKEENAFYDFSSGVGGNVLTFTRHYHKCNNAEAIKILKKYANFDGEIQVRKKLVATEIAKKYSQPKKNSKPGKMPTLADDYMERYEKDDSKLFMWEVEGISRESLNKYQVYYDRFSDRLVYPIRNMEGRIVNVGGRTLDKDWKEKGLRKYTYFKPWNSGLQVIYGLFENIETIKKQRQIIVFEGVKSVMLADTLGIKNTGAILTSHLNPYQLKILAKLGCDVVFALDNDININDDYNIGRLKQYVNVFYLKDTKDLLGEKDSPIDKGLEVFRELYKERRRLL